MQEVLDRVQASMRPDRASLSSQFRVFRCAKNIAGTSADLGLPLVIELPAALLAAPRYIKDVSAHLDHIVRDAFSQSLLTNRGTRTHRFTCLDPVVYVRFYHCGCDVTDNVLQASQVCPLWFSQQNRSGETSASDLVPCNPMHGDSLYPEPQLKFQNTARGIKAGIGLLNVTRRRSFSQANSALQSGATCDTDAFSGAIQPTNIVSNVPFQRSLSVKILFQNTGSESMTEEILKFRQSFETFKGIPLISIIGSQSCCSDTDVLEWNAFITKSSRSYIILDLNSSSDSYKPLMRPESLSVARSIEGAPCTAVEFSFGAIRNETGTLQAIELQCSKPDHQILMNSSFDFKQILAIYHSLYQGFMSSLYRDTVLLCNLCNTSPPNEMTIDYQRLCECMYKILDSPLLVKDIENALSSTSFQSLIPRPSPTETGFEWSLERENIFWKGVFAGSIFLELNEDIIGRCENRDGLLSMRWNDSLRRVVKFYEHIGDNNKWAKPGYNILFAQEKMQKQEHHDLHRYMFDSLTFFPLEIHFVLRMLINIVTSRRLIEYECRLVRDSSLTSPPSRSLPEKSLNQAIARCIIKCEGCILEEGQSFTMNAYDCFGETTLMYAAAMNDCQLARYVINAVRIRDFSSSCRAVLAVADFDYIIAESRHPHALHQTALYMALVRGNLEIAEAILKDIMSRLEKMR
jgi:hypothetical protein